MNILNKLLQNKNLLSFTIINKEEFMQQKLSLTIMLPSEEWVKGKKPAEEELEKLSKYLYKKHKGKKYKYVFISFYLLGMDIRDGAWATGHFNPTLNIEVMPYNLSGKI